MYAKIENMRDYMGRNVEIYECYGCHVFHEATSTAPHANILLPSGEHRVTLSRGVLLFLMSDTGKTIDKVVGYGRDPNFALGAEPDEATKEAA